MYRSTVLGAHGTHMIDRDRNRNCNRNRNHNGKRNGKRAQWEWPLFSS